jgi:peptide/nickel transport system permease protein
MVDQTAPAPVSRSSAEAGSDTFQDGQIRLIWRRFRRHRLAVVGGIVIALLYVVVAFAEFFATSDPNRSTASLSLVPPQPIHFFDDDGSFRPHVLRLDRRRDPATLQLVYTPNPSRKVDVAFFTPGFRYSLLGLFETDIHFIGVVGARAEDTLFLLGTDVQGRDMWSRTVYATRVSLTIGLLGVAASLVLGVTLGGISGLLGGRIDEAIQRLIEILRSIPTIPLWMGLAASLPSHWTSIQLYFAITIIISLVSWTELARVTRGRFLSLREEDFITAARLDGCGNTRIIVGHMVPSFLSHIIAATTLAFPAMILSETSLSFLGLGLRPPAISWGVMLQQAQNVQAIALTPWLLFPAVPVVLSVLAFNFLGDGLRDAADPYAR